jgi:hypothetical protein
MESRLHFLCLVLLIAGTATGCDVKAPSKKGAGATTAPAASTDDPVKAFEQIVREIAGRADWGYVEHKDDLWHVHRNFCELPRYDVRKTDSVVRPLEGIVQVVVHTGRGDFATEAEARAATIANLDFGTKGRNRRWRWQWDQDSKEWLILVDPNWPNPYPFVPGVLEEGQMLLEPLKNDQPKP